MSWQHSAYGLESDTGIDWLTQAACRAHNPEWWTVLGRGNRRQAARNDLARAICGSCPVTAECWARAQRLGASGTIVAGREFRAERKPARMIHARRTCPVCEVEYELRNSRQIYCSKRCNDRQQRRRATARARGMELNVAQPQGMVA